MIEEREIAIRIRVFFICSSGSLLYSRPFTQRATSTLRLTGSSALTYAFAAIAYPLPGRRSEIESPPSVTSPNRQASNDATNPECEIQNEPSWSPLSMRSLASLTRRLFGTRTQERTALQAPRRFRRGVDRHFGFAAARHR